MSVLILREKMISAMMSERQKMDTSVQERNKMIEQLEENVTRLQLKYTDCSDAAAQTISTLGDEVRHKGHTYSEENSKIWTNIHLTTSQDIAEYMYMYSNNVGSMLGPNLTFTHFNSCIILHQWAEAGIRYVLSLCVCVCVCISLCISLKNFDKTAKSYTYT